MLILTDVDAVYRNYGSAGATRIDRLTIGEAQRLLDSGELGQGSMRPKVQAATSFLRDGGERAVIARLDQGLEALAGTTGTEIVR